MLMYLFLTLEEIMNVMMIRLLSTIGLAIVAILGVDLSAATDPAASTAGKPAMAIAEKTMEEVEGKLGKVTIVDARGSGEKTIKGAIFIAADANDKDIHAKLKNKTAEIIVYCGNVKCPASMTLAERLVGLGYTNVSHYAGGIAEWTENDKLVDEHK